MFAARDLRRIANSARRKRGRIAPDKRLIALLDDEGVNLVSQAWPQAGGFWRCQVQVKIAGSDSPNACWCDIDASEWPRLRTWREVKPAG